MAPPSRPSLTLKAAKKLEAMSEALLELTPSDSLIAISKENAVFIEIPGVMDTLSGVKDMCDIGQNTYPNYPAIRETMIEAGNQIYRVKQDLSDIKNECLSTRTDDLIAWRAIGLRLANLASRLRAVKFVPTRKEKKEA